MKCIIIEGPQGCGKTTLANYLREKVPASNLYRLAGQKDKTVEGKNNSIKMYDALLDYMKAMENTGVNLIFDRTFFSEEVYASLGYKDYSFNDKYKELLDKLSKLNFEIIYISLYLKDTSLYTKRLERDHHNYQNFAAESSIKQQNKYKELIKDVEKLENAKVYEIAMDNFEKAYKEIDKILNI